MKAVVTVIGKDNKGIIAKVSAKCFEYGGNISEISQSVLKEYLPDHAGRYCRPDRSVY